jgi:hypothetical protein
MKWYHWFLILVISGGGYVVYTQTRGLRNNNPGNIRKTADKWKGLRAKQTDDEFFQFDSSVWGIRAMAKLLQNYQKRYGLDSVEQIINRWAPPNENDTNSYVKSVAQNVGVTPSQNLDLNSVDVLSRLVKAVIRHENGINPYSDETIIDAIGLI